jgi:hypothetical protein
VADLPGAATPISTTDGLALKDNFKAQLAIGMQAAKCDSVKMLSFGIRQCGMEWRQNKKLAQTAAPTLVRIGGRKCSGSR